MRTITVSLAGREYSIRQLPIKADRAWREKHRGPLDQFLVAVDATVELAKTEFPDGDGLVKAVGQLLSAHAANVSRTLLNSTDLLAEALFAYSPELQADREHIETEGFPDEILGAFLEVLKFSHPLGSLAALVMNPGRLAHLTLPSSPAPSGASGKTSSTPTSAPAS